MLTRFKDKFEWLYLLLGEKISGLGFTPNLLSFLGLFSAVLSFYLFIVDFFSAASLFLLLNGFFDLADGAAARFSGRASVFGGVLDSTVDRVSDFLLITGLAFNELRGVAVIVAFTAIHSCLMVSYVRARAEAEGLKGRVSVGLVERPERLIILFFSALSRHVFAGLLLLSVLSYFTVIQRVIHVKRVVKNL